MKSITQAMMLRLIEIVADDRGIPAQEKLAYLLLQ
jgi:hypothetical protein